MAREQLKSRLGFILLSAGCAIGIGNVWKFPYVTGENGGGLFVLIYLFFLIIFGVPIMTMEFSMGRAAQKSPVKLYQQLQKKGQKWHIHGIFSLVGNYLLMMFYTTVSGWMLRYFVSTAAGDFTGLDTAGIKSYYDGMLADPVTMIIYLAVIIAVGALVCSFSLQGGLEKITKVMMSALIIIMVILAVNSIFTKGGAEGLSFYLLPDISKIQDKGIGNVIVAAMNQSFFTLSIGIGSMAIFGSYIGKDRSLLGESVNIALLDTFVAITSGLIIFPACFAYGVDVNSGPELIFLTLPNIFNNMPLGRLWGSLFFVFMSFSALSTVLAVFENITSCTRDLTGWSRKKASLINGISLFVLSIPCALGFNLLKDVAPLGKGTNIMDFEDFLVNNIILPLGSLVIVLFCTRRIGWGWDNFVGEANQGKGLKVQKWMKGYMTYVLPVVILIVFIVGLVS
ncbi:MAG: sodium-dependent transporter [Ruminiclostridium sp.]|nr:sodium-dependent transporter [Ruminiclostridium sp.]